MMKQLGNTFAFCLFCTVILMQAGRVQAVLLSEPEVTHPARWQSFYHTIPQAFRNNRVVLLQLRTKKGLTALAASLAECSVSSVQDVDGCYRNGGYDLRADATISLLNTLHGEQALRVFAHEYGHFVWFQVMNSHQRSAYRLVWQKQKRANHLITAYAGVNAREGFAEAFSFFLLHRAQLQKKDSASLRFLQHLAAAQRQAAS